jgi:hypothetical protein
VLQTSFQNSFAPPGHTIQLAPFRSIALDPPLNPAIDVFKEHRLWTSPAAPDAAKESRGVEKAETETGNQKEPQPDVMGEKSETNKVEPHRIGIQMHSGVSAHLYPG